MLTCVLQYVLTRGLFCCLFPELLLCNSGNKHQIDILISARPIYPKSTYITLFLIWYNESINNLFHLLSLHSADESIIDCWWCHKYITWHNYFDMWTRKTICNSFSIRYIHSYFHAFSYKEELLEHHHYVNIPHTIIVLIVRHNN